jgi:hypothetical protein
VAKMLMVVTAYAEKGKVIVDMSPSTRLTEYQLADIVEIMTAKLAALRIELTGE